MVDKYDFELDMVGDNSNSLILRQIQPYSEVLEFGPAHGRMTKYLKESLFCRTTIVELDENAGQQASMFADNAFIGSENGNIENYYWFEQLENSKFDYIIFADVLEHLYNPWLVLASVKDLLKDSGEILISVPNIGHNSVLIDLLNNKFEYREVGLMDNTHIRFFTYPSLTNLVLGAGLAINKEINAYNVVENTEFGNAYTDVPDEVADFLKQREYGDVYQFIWSLKAP